MSHPVALKIFHSKPQIGKLTALKEKSLIINDAIPVSLIET